MNRSNSRPKKISTSQHTPVAAAAAQQNYHNYDQQQQQQVPISFLTALSNRYSESRQPSPPQSLTEPLLATNVAASQQPMTYGQLSQEVERLRLENNYLKTENDQMITIERQFWSLMEEREELTAELSELRKSVHSFSSHVEKSTNNGKGQLQSPRTTTIGLLDEGTATMKVPALERELASLKRTQDDMQRALEECMDLLVAQSGSTTNVEKGTIVPKFLQWLQYPQRPTVPVGGEERQGLSAEVQRLSYDLQRVTEELDKADLSREQALEEVEICQSRLAEANAHLVEARTAYSMILNSNRLMEVELSQHKDCRKTIQDLETTAAERAHIIAELQLQLNRLMSTADAQKGLEDDAKRIKSELESRQGAASTTEAQPQPPATTASGGAGKKAPATPAQTPGKNPPPGPASPPGGGGKAAAKAPTPKK